jgi:hypothetical protein
MDGKHMDQQSTIRFKTDLHVCPAVSIPAWVQTAVMQQASNQSAEEVCASREAPLHQVLFLALWLPSSGQYPWLNYL